MFDAIIFDCDGVLVDSEVLSRRGELRVLEKFGLPYTEEEFSRRFLGLHDIPFFDALRSDYEARLRRSAPEDFEQRLLEGRRAEMEQLTAIAGADRALAAARQRFEKLAVASSSRAHFLDKKLKRTGLFDACAPHIYSADLVENAKPAPDIFLYAAEKLQAAPERCLVLEDSENGVLAAKAAGMTALGFLGGGHVLPGHDEALVARGAKAVVDDFDHFIRHLRDDIPALLTSS
ncbi:MAG: HAD family phosphatase [Pseudomonadota bacterium]